LCQTYWEGKEKGGSLPEQFAAESRSSAGKKKESGVIETPTAASKIMKGEKGGEKESKISSRGKGNFNKKKSKEAVGMTLRCF